MEAAKYRILSLGDLDNSAGGIYNAGTIGYHENKRILLPRVEKNYQFTNDVKAVLIEGTIEELKHGIYKATYLTRENFPSDTRIEDFRLFIYNEQLYAAHTLVYGWNGMSNNEPQLITPAISKIKDGKIILFDHLDLPIKRKKVEKNWQIFTYNGELYCLYSLDPLIIFKQIGFSWKCIREDENGLSSFVSSKLSGSGYLSLSAITHYKDQYMLGFWHVYIGRAYMVQGVFILDMMRLEVVNFTDVLIDGSTKDWVDGYKPGIPYVSGIVATDTNVEVWCGENDSHTCLLEFNRNELNNYIQKHPYKSSRPLRVLFDDAGIGDFVCARYALEGWLNKNPEGTINLFLKQGQLFEMAAILRHPRIKICQYSDQKIHLDLSTNTRQSEYHEKLAFGDFKEFYAAKMGVSPNIPNTSHITEIDSYKNCIVLCPFAAWDYRNWNIKNWKLLAQNLIERGFRVIVADKYLNRCKDIPGEMFCEKSLMDNFKIIKGAKLVISNESGLAHVSGLVGTPCIVLSGWLNPKLVYSLTKNTWIWNQETKNHVKNLQLITVQNVLNKMTEMGVL